MKNINIEFSDNALEKLADIGIDGEKEVKSAIYEWLEDEVEPLARMMAAEKMGLVKDKLGENQPYELWSQCIPDARRYLGLE